jgi:hypothetical protein
MALKGVEPSNVPRRAAASFNQSLEAIAAAPGIMTVTDNRTSSASAPTLVSGCASALRSATGG